ncbi:MAG: hypothetical protein ACOY3N_12060 [Bradyrhizobium sp.]|jgi:hypothetical protein|uniref:hypothetical protein n=1 Tax=Hyphomicrobiales TaxID=356 RepID=UPI0037287CD2
MGGISGRLAAFTRTSDGVATRTDNELCGLRPILDRLAEETGLNIPTAVIYYWPDPGRPAARPMTPFDPDAPISWVSGKVVAATFPFFSTAVFAGGT